MITFNFNFPENSARRKIAQERMKKTIANEITPVGICIENSPYYHTYVMTLLMEIIAMYEEYNLHPPEAFNYHLEKIKNFLTHIKNKTLPTIGDINFSSTRLKFYPKFSFHTIKFIDTRGKSGTQLTSLDKIYPESGYHIFREHWGNGKDSFVNAAQFILINTNLNIVHKHSDNLSFELISNEQDLIVDTGHNTYTRDAFRRYYQSVQAHNALSVDNQTYSLMSSINSKVELKYFTSNKVISSAVCKYTPSNKNEK